MAGQRSTRSRRRAATVPPRPRTMISPDVAAVPTMVAPGPAEPAVSTRSRRAAPAAPDYTQDYAIARRDLRRIALFSIVLFGLMLALYFSGALQRFV